MTTLSEQTTDVLIIGSGAAGLSLALRLAPYCKITLLSKGLLNEGTSLYAQGGIAAVFDEADSISSHVQDTLNTGSGLCDKEIVEFVTGHACQCIQWLIDQGVLFDTEINSNGQQRYHLTREGGHTHRRILHSADATGKTVQNTLIKKALAHRNIDIRERYNAVDLITSHQRVVGAYVWSRDRSQVETCRSRIVVLATGGASKVYQYTTNPEIASGDGIAMAWRAGCRVANLEFNQFHPTCLFHPKAPNFLLTEALRGEGAYLKRPDGSRFMPDFDPLLELAPRDIVARAIDHEMKRLGADCMYLDISHKSSEFIVQHFPMIYKKLLSLGIDLTKEPIPVVPAAHYTCGGVMVNQQGRTDLEGLYAIGEVSYTGLHGANRMASNSLLECLVYAWSAAEDILVSLPHAHSVDALSAWDESRVHNSDEQVVIQHNWHELRLFMWDYMGIVRTNKRLERALRRINTLKQEVNEYYAHFRISNNLLELRNLLEVAELMVRCAMMRKESRGLHYTLDYPHQIDKPQLSVLSPV